MQPQPRIHDKVGYCLVETLICNKLSERAEGKLHYQIWQHQDDQSFGISLCKMNLQEALVRNLFKLDRSLTVFW